MVSQSACSDLGEIVFWIEGSTWKTLPSTHPFSPPCLCLFILTFPHLPHLVHHSPTTLTTTSYRQTSQKQSCLLFGHIQNRQTAEVPGWSTFFSFPLPKSSPANTLPPCPSPASATWDMQSPGLNTSGPLDQREPQRSLLARCFSVTLQSNQAVARSYRAWKDGLRNCKNLNPHLNWITFSCFVFKEKKIPR